MTPAGGLRSVTNQNHTDSKKQATHISQNFDKWPQA